MYGKINPNVVLRSALDLTRFAQTKILIVGGTAGIGQALAKAAAAQRAECTVIGRTFRDTGVENLLFKKADLSSMKEAQKVAMELPAADYDFVIFTNGIVPVATRVATVRILRLCYCFFVS